MSQSLFGKLFPTRSAAPRPEVGGIDPVLAATAIGLVGIGVVMVYSASTIEATVVFKDSQFFLKKQVVYAALALFVMWLVSRFDYRRLQHPLATYAIYGGTLLMLLACVAGLGKRVGGAARWIAVGPVNIQPAEGAKVALVAWLAYSLAKKGDQVKTFKVGFVPHFVAAGLMILLLLKQPDLGSSVVLLLLTFALLVAAGAKSAHVVGAGIAGVGAVVLLVLSREYRMARLAAFLDMEHHRQDVAYQPFQSVMSFGSGGTFGLGLGRGLQTLYLPEAHTDFIAAIVGEELGFLGILGLIATYLLLVSRGIKIALEADDDYGSYLAFGLSTLFGIQVLVNLAVAMAIVPTKGLTLPFLSYGGSSLLVNAAAVGLLLSISRKRDRSFVEASGDGGEPTEEAPKGPAPDATAHVLAATARDEVIA
jgi:cell division protein FtsW